MKVDRAGVFDISTEAYHADPAPEPSLSSTLARVIINQTPLHAWTASPRLNPDFVPKEKETFDIGRACHAILLGKGGEFDVVYADDWTKKIDQETRKASRAAGRSPVLLHQYQAAIRMSEIAKAKLAEAKLELDPARSEMAVLAQIDGVWCRALIDNALIWPSAPLIDLKTCADASPEACLKAVQSYQYDVQWQWYRQVWRAATGEERPMLFLFVEKEPPHSCLIVDLFDVRGQDGDWGEDAAMKCEEARRLWRLCLETNEWPDYPTQIATLYAPQWHRNRWADKQTVQPSEAAIARARTWQAPEGANG